MSTVVTDFREAEDKQLAGKEDIFAEEVMADSAKGKAVEGGGGGSLGKVPIPELLRKLEALIRLFQ